jgi:hypothetical protein
MSDARDYLGPGPWKSSSSEASDDEDSCDHLEYFVTDCLEFGISSGSGEVKFELES